MAQKTVSQLKDSISGLLTGINLNNISGLNNCLERAARILVGKAYIPDVMESTALTLYDGVYDYVAPTSIYGTSLIDVAPQGVSRNTWDYTYKKPLADFDREKGYTPSGAQSAFKFKNGVGIIRIDSSFPRSRAILDPMTDDTDWTAAGSASALAEDETVFYSFPASLRFTLTGSSTGTLTKTISSANIPTYEDVAVGFLAIDTPSIANLTNIAVRVGSSASAYDEVTETDGFLGAWTTNDWLLVAFDFSSATSTGTPDWTAIDYLQIRIAHTGTITNFRVGGFWLSLPSPVELIYQTTAFFLASGSTPSATITNDNDTVLLSDASYVIYELECAKTIAMQESGGVKTTMIQGFDEQMIPLYDTFTANNPSDVIRNVGSYYE